MDFNVLKEQKEEKNQSLKKFIILKCLSEKLLENSVNDKILQGYIPVSSIVINKDFFYQSMILKGII